MKGKIALIQVLFIFTVVMVLVNVLEDGCDKSKSKNKFSDIKSEIVISDEENTEVSYTDDGRLTRYMPLYQRNNEFAGWVKVEGTQIDYPVVQNTQTNAYYLHRDFDRKESPAGVPFLDYQCTQNPQSDNMIIYSHNMKNGEMFHDLLKYQNIDFYNEHKNVKFDTMYAAGEYEVFSVMRTKVGSANEFKYYDYINFKDEPEFNSFIKTCIEKSLINTGITPQLGDKLLTLSTCSYNTDNERFVVFCRKK